MRIFLAGTSTLQFYTDKFNEIKPKYVLCTFFEGADACKQAIKFAGDTEHFLLDSGAFTFMNTKTGVTKEELEAYCDTYIDFINKNDVKYFFEMDVDSIFGLEYVEYLRKKIENRTQKKCIPVWHMNRGISYWKKMCEDYSYVAIGGLVVGASKVSQKDLVKILQKLVSYANSKGVKVHGLGFTKTSLLDSIHFYSVDSTSWLKSVAFGAHLQEFNKEKGKIVNVSIPNNDKTKKINFKTVYEKNFDAWLKYQSYMDSRKEYRK